ncbi:MAG: DNA repair protein RecN, partial [Sciscionella sp.]
MLGEMRISDLGVIGETAIELHPGLTVFTGETGAGKTMVVTGLSLLGGGRADASRVRGGASRAVVEGRFELPAGGLAEAVLTEAGAERDADGSVIALRTVGSDGRSRAHLGGRSVPVGVLAELAEQLLAVHGQNDQLRLLRPGEQRAVLDRFAGEPVGALLTDYRKTREEWLRAIAELTERTERSRELAREADLLRHGLVEIAEIGPKPGEDAELVAEARRLGDIDQLREAASGAQYAVSGPAEGDPDAPGALGMLGEARRRLAGTDDPRLRALEPRLAEAAVLVADVGTELGGYLDALEADPARLEQVLARQSELKALTRKYAADVDGVLAWAEEAERRLAGLDTSEEAIVELTWRRDELAKRLATLAGELTVARQAAAAELAKAVTAELGGLAMPHAAIEVSVQQRQVYPADPAALTIGRKTYQAGQDGVDDVELRLRPHAGANGLPINKGASGGELSRVMLALEVVLAHSDP